MKAVADCRTHSCARYIFSNNQIVPYRHHYLKHHNELVKLDGDFQLPPKQKLISLLVILRNRTSAPLMGDMREVTVSTRWQLLLKCLVPPERKQNEYYHFPQNRTAFFMRVYVEHRCRLVWSRCVWQRCKCRDYAGAAEWKFGDNVGNNVSPGSLLVNSQNHQIVV